MHGIAICDAGASSAISQSTGCHMPETSLYRLPAASRSLLAGSLALCLGGCSALVAPLPLWDVAVLGGAATTARLSLVTAPGTASDTVVHMRQLPTSVCIEYNPQVQVSDIVPALQMALREHRVESRVYESPDGLVQCPVWLRYTAQLDWDLPPFSDDYKAYISTASLTLRSTSGTLLSSSHYRIDSPVGRSKWASTRDKLTPIVSALLGATATGATPRAAAPASASTHLASGSAP